MLKGHTAIVTGGSRGIGAAAAKKLASLGADIAVVYAGNQAAADAVKEAGGRAKVLKVNGAFHCPYMSDAAAGFGKVLSDMETSDPVIPVYADLTGLPYNEDIKSTLTSQIDHPVKWETIIRNMIDDGVDTFVEIGPGKTLVRLIKRISSDVRLFNVLVPEDLEKLVAEV